MSFIDEVNEENVCIHIPAEVEESYLSSVKIDFSNHFLANKIKRVFFNFSAVQQINSLGLSVILNLQLFFRLRNIEVVAVNVNEAVTSLFKTVGLDVIIESQTLKTISSSTARRKSLENEVQKLKLELTYQKELYARVTQDLENKLAQVNATLATRIDQLRSLEKSNSVRELAAGVAHEFNNIIGGILGYAQLAQSKNSREMVEKALENIIALSKRSEGITGSLLNFSRKKPPQVNLVNLTNMVQSTLAILQIQADELKIKIHVDFKPVEMIYADENLLSQMILNLAINAFHAMENGGDLFISIFKEHEFIKIKIRDTGIGIDASTIDRIFQPFFTTKGALGGGSKSGTGLGLSVSKSIAEMHGGSLSVESEKGKGACFIITFPEKNANKSYKEYVEQMDLSDLNPTEKQSKASKILIVDDEKAIRSVMVATLTDLGHTVLEASNGEDGVKLYQSHKPDLVFLDIVMPRMNGMDAYLEIKKINSQAPIIFITGQAGEYLEQILENLTRTENIYLLRKPFDIDELLRVVEAVLSHLT